MKGKTLCYGIDWKDEDKVIVHPPEPDSPYWEVVIIRDKYSKRIEANEMIIEYENDKIVSVHY
ncbi:hypothetical protein J7J62_03885 [bacterium]|nr:hypothetical protein [bacterium]